MHKTTLIVQTISTAAVNANNRFCEHRGYYVVQYNSVGGGFQCQQPNINQSKLEQQHKPEWNITVYILFYLKGSVLLQFFHGFRLHQVY